METKTTTEIINDQFINTKHKKKLGIVNFTETREDISKYRYKKWVAVDIFIKLVDEIRILIIKLDSLHDWADGDLSKDDGDGCDNYSCVCHYKEYSEIKKELSDKILELEKTRTDGGSTK